MFFDSLQQTQIIASVFAIGVCAVAGLLKLNNSSLVKTKSRKTIKKKKAVDQQVINERREFILSQPLARKRDSLKKKKKKRLSRSFSGSNSTNESKFLRENSPSRSSDYLQDSDEDNIDIPLQQIFTKPKEEYGYEHEESFFGKTVATGYENEKSFSGYTQENSTKSLDEKFVYYTYYDSEDELNHERKHITNQRSSEYDVVDDSDDEDDDSDVESLEKDVGERSNRFQDGSELTEWNTRFQSAIKMLRNFTPSTPVKKRIQANLDLLHLSQDFLYSAQSYGKIIISEVFVPDKDKTIKPVVLGGVIGGQKYRVHNILFKFATDYNNLFGSDYAAAKVAGHELKGLINYFNCGIEDLNVPLMCLVDYRGFRLIAMSVVPISPPDTLVYGSSDAGRTVFNSDENLNEKMCLAAAKLNLKPHKCGDTLLYSPCDLEGHISKEDRKYYLVDFSRVFPPETPINGIKNAHLSRLFRPEFVLNYSKPLCSDAFRACQRFLLIEILARVLKNNLRFKLREKMRELKLPLEEPYRVLVIDYLNLVFGESEQSSKYWRKRIVKDIKKYFVKALTHEEICLQENEELNLKPTLLNNERDTEFLRQLLTRLQKLTKMKISKRMRSKVSQNFLVQKPFKDTDLVNIGERVKHMNIISEAQGFYYHVEGLYASEQRDSKSAQKFYQMAIHNFEEALDSTPNNKEILLNCALTWSLSIEDELQEKLKNQNAIVVFDKNNPKVQKSQEYCLRAIFCPPKYDTFSLFQYAQILEKIGDLEAAEDYYLQSLEADPNTVECLHAYGNFLTQQNEHEYAERFYIRFAQNTAESADLESVRTSSTNSQVIKNSNLKKEDVPQNEKKEEIKKTKKRWWGSSNDKKL